MDSNAIATVLNALPTAKLIDAVSRGIGKAYEPRHKRKMADATAYEISVVGNAMRNAADLPILYNQEGVVINSEDFNRLMQRAGTRLALQETMKQYNIESVVDNAYDILEKEDHCSSEPVDQGWINRFFDSVADVSDEDLQMLWGKVLAGEIKQPGKFSLRTLEIIRNISSAEAAAFQRVLPVVIHFEGVLAVRANSDLLKEYDVNYADFIWLDECGLITSNSASWSPKISSQVTKTIYNHEEVVIISGVTEKESEIDLGIYILTQAGRELYYLLQPSSAKGFIRKVTKDIYKQYSSKVRIAIHKVISTQDTSVEYEDDPCCYMPEKEDDIKIVNQ